MKSIAYLFDNVKYYDKDILFSGFVEPTLKLKAILLSHGTFEISRSLQWKKEMTLKR